MKVNLKIRKNYSILNQYITKQIGIIFFLIVTNHKRKAQLITC